MILFLKIFFFILCIFNIFICTRKTSIFESEYIVEVSFTRIRKNAWDIVNENHEIFNSSPEGNSGKDEFNFSWYKWNINYDKPFSSQISQVILVVLIIIVLICVILSLICCYYSVPKEEDFSKSEYGIYCFENEERSEEFHPIYQKNAQIRRYILTGKTPNNELNFSTRY